MHQRAVAAPPPVSVEELHDRAAIGALTPEWERLRAEVAARGGTAGPFLSPAWFAIYAASLAGNPGDLKLLVAHRSGRLTGVLPLYAERRRVAGVPARVLRSLSDDHSQRFDALVDPVDGNETARALFAHLSRDASWDLLELRDVPSPRSDGAGAGPTLGADLIVAAARAAGHPTALWPAMVSPRLRLPATVEELDRQRSAKFRSNLRRRLKKLTTEVGPVELERIPDGADRATLTRALDEGFRLEAAGWKGEAGTAISCDPLLRARYQALAGAFSAEGKAALYFLTVGGVRKAFRFSLVEDGVYYLFKPGYDPALANYGLGHLLVDAVVRDLTARGVRELDFLGDDMPWKREWTDEVRAHAWRYVFARRPFGRALHAWKFRLAPGLKKILDRR